MDDVHFHDLHPTYSTEASKQGASTIELSTAMRHRTLQMLDRYTHIQAEMTKHDSEGIVKKFNLKKTEAVQEIINTQEIPQALEQNA
ncbi:hypothetical protein NEOC65_002088 [Neochlamydia sp. AcF65]|nr:hypothetical protein [Neochlamydia sp. AcF65]MBS4170403.1 hypothetical protein [Neochlamydia sp. AcF95]NGY95383.1 hypothetical protein [Neochlamydia sp. AcF84]